MTTNYTFLKLNTFSRAFMLVSMFMSFQVLTCFSQTTEKEAMAKLSFLMGNWKGSSTVFLSDGSTKNGTVIENVHYEMDGNILVLNVNSTSLQLHTIINYNVKEKQYYYTPFTKRGGSSYKAEYKNSQFIVWVSDTRRLIFERTEAGQFHEYGENLKDGKWSKYFEDLLNPAALMNYK